MRISVRWWCLLVLVPLISACSWWPWSGQSKEESEPEPVPVVETPDPVAARQALVRDHIEKGQLALETDRLSLPENDCAVSHFRAALELDPNNIEAQMGLRGVVSRYLQLAKVAHGNGDDKAAQAWLQRAEEVGGGSARIAGVRSKLKNTPKGQNNREIEFLPATDYLLSRDDLDERGAEITQRLGKIASRAAERKRAALVLARSQEEGEWIAKTLRQSVPGYAMKVRVAIASKPAVILVSESKLAESQRLLEQKQGKREVEQAKQKARQKAEQYLESDEGKQVQEKIRKKKEISGGLKE